MVSCLASFRSLVPQQDSRNRSVQHSPSAPRDRFLRGSNSGRNRIRDVLDNLTGSGSHKTHIHSDSTESKIDDLQNESKPSFLYKVFSLKTDVEVVHEPPEH